MPYEKWASESRIKNKKFFNWVFIQQIFQRISVLGLTLLHFLTEITFNNFKREVAKRTDSETLTVVKTSSHVKLTNKLLELHKNLLFVNSFWNVKKNSDNSSVSFNFSCTYSYSIKFNWKSIICRMLFVIYYQKLTNIVNDEVVLMKWIY